MSLTLLRRFPPLLVCLFLIMSCGTSKVETRVEPVLHSLESLASVPNAETLGLHLEFGGIHMEGSRFLVLGGGCFWCTEAVYEKIEGVLDVVSGYAGGKGGRPNYGQVTRGDTGYAEVIRIEYDPSRVTFRELVDLFWHAHDPTTLNRQGYDVGTQYRSVLYYQNDEEKADVEASLAEGQELWPDPIVTEIGPLQAFYPAEEEHQNFYENNPFWGYCQVVITPKLRKLGLTGTEQVKIPDLYFNR